MSSTPTDFCSPPLYLADLLHHKAEDNQEGDGIYTPGHAHHFSNKGIDPGVLNSSLKKHIAAGAHEGERRLNDFSAEPDERMNPHFADHIKDVVNASEEEEAKPSGEWQIEIDRAGD